MRQIFLFESRNSTFVTEHKKNDKINAKYLDIADNQAHLLRSLDERCLQLRVVDVLKRHIGEYIFDKGIKSLWVWERQLRKRIQTQCLNGYALFYLSIDWKWNVG